MGESEYCELVNILIPKYIKGQCTNAERAFLEAHCDDCPECRAKLNRAKDKVKTSPAKEVLFLSRPKNPEIPRHLHSKEKKKVLSIRGTSAKPGYLDSRTAVMPVQNQLGRVITPFIATAAYTVDALRSVPLPHQVVDWKDSVLESRMREITRVYSRKIRYSDVIPITELDLTSNGSNQISDIRALSSLTNVEKLTLNNNRISDISVLSSLKNLKFLALAFNQIKDISALSSLTYLDRLDLSYNKIRNYKPIKHLETCVVLK